MAKPTKKAISDVVDRFAAQLNASDLVRNVAVDSYRVGIMTGIAMCQPAKGSKGSAIDGIELPEWLPEESWIEWDEHRRSMKGKPWTALAARKTINTLTKAREQGFDPVRMIDRAIERGWQGLVLADECRAQPAVRPMLRGNDRGPNGRNLAPHEIPQSRPVRTFKQQAADNTIDEFMRRTNGVPDDSDVIDMEPL